VAIERQIDLKRVCASREAYAAHLARLYGFYLPLEDALRRHVAAREAGVGERRRKTPLLACDLAVLGVDTARLPLCDALPPLEKEEEAMGCLYVVEGASLGGQIISRILRQRLDIGPRNGAAFYNGYGDETPAMWEAFRSYLEAYAHDEARQEAVIGAARATFEALGAWLSRKELSSIDA
jgi:Heme oxygenase